MMWYENEEFKKHINNKYEKEGKKGYSITSLKILCDDWDVKYDNTLARYYGNGEA